MDVLNSILAFNLDLNHLYSKLLVVGAGISLSLLASYASYLQLRHTKSTQYIWITTAFIVTAVDYITQVFIILRLSEHPSFVSGYVPGMFSIATVLFAILLSMASLIKPSYITRDNIISMVSTYTGPVVAILLIYMTVILTIPAIGLPIPNFPGSILPIWEYVACVIFMVALVGFTLRRLSKNRKVLLIIFPMTVAFISTEFLISASSSITASYFIWAQYIKLFALGIFSFVLIIRDNYRESIDRTSRFTISHQLLVILVTLIGMVGVLMLFSIRSRQLLLSEISYEYFFDLMSALNEFGIFFTGAIIICSIGMLASSIFRIRQQFQNFSRTIEDIKSGQLSINLEVYNDDEFGVLAVAFDQVVSQLKASSQILKEKVQKQTETLTTKLNESEDTNKRLFQTKKDLEFAKYSVEQEKARDEAILASIGEGIIVVNKEGRIEKLNHKAVELTGLNPETDLREKATDKIKLVDEEGNYISDTKQPLTLALNIGDRTATDKYSFQHTNGQRFPAYLTATPIVLSGTVIGAIQVFRDITKEKEIDRAKSEFVSLASHQLRTPLTAINWYTEALQGKRFGDLNDKQMQYLQEVANGTSRLIELVNALLNVSRIELGAFIVHPQEIELLEFTDGVIKELLPAIQERDLILERKYPTEKIKMQLDPNLMHIVIHNLMTNAIKYTPPQGRVTLQIEKSNQYVTLHVTDTGYGIPADQQNKIFSKLFRASNVNSRESQGTGLGLYIVKSIIDNSDGKIWFESKEDKGTTFSVSLPLYGMQKIDNGKTLI